MTRPDKPAAASPTAESPTSCGSTTDAPEPDVPAPDGPVPDGPTPAGPNTGDPDSGSLGPGTSGSDGSDSNPDPAPNSDPAPDSDSDSNSDSDSDDPDSDDQGPSGPGPDPGPSDPGPGGPTGGGATPEPDPETPTTAASPPGSHPTAAPKTASLGTEVRVPLSTLLGLDQRAGELPGWGPIPASAARRLVARQHRAQWRWVVVDDHGHLLAEGITRHRPAPRRRNGPPGGIVELHIPATRLAALAAEATEHGGWAKVITDIAEQYRHHTEQADPDAALDDRPDARFPHAALRRHTEVRDRTCVGPGCRTSSRRCDQDHTVDHHHGGPTVRAGLGPLCRHDHLLKTEGHWRLEQPEPGRFIWTSPLNRQYRVEPEPILPPPITPAPRPDDPRFDEPAPGPVYADDEQPDLHRPDRGPPERDNALPCDDTHRTGVPRKNGVPTKNGVPNKDAAPGNGPEEDPAPF